MSALSDDIRAGLDVRGALEAAGITAEDPDYAELLASECDVQDRLVRILRAARRTEAQSKALAEILADNRERKGRLDTKAERLRGVVLHAMQELGLKRLEGPDLTASVGSGKPKALITDPAAIPDALCRITREPNKTAIADAMKVGPVPGAEWSNGSANLTVRTK